MVVTNELLKQESDLRWEAHRREHDVQERVVIHEASAIKENLSKADEALEKRLEAMNEFRAQLGNQASTFVTLAIFDAYAKETRDKSDLIVSNSNEKIDALIRTVVSRHDSDFDNLREALQEEREIRKKSEGSINTFKYIVSFFGLSGIGTILYILVNNLK